MDGSTGMFWDCDCNTNTLPLKMSLQRFKDQYLTFWTVGFCDKHSPVFKCDLPKIDEMMMDQQECFWMVTSQLLSLLKVISHGPTRKLGP